MKHEILMTRIAKREEKAENTRRKLNKCISNIIVFAICLIYAILLLVPFYVIFATSLTPLVEYGSSTTFVWFPETVTFEAYGDILFEDPMILTTGMSSIVTGFLNTLWVAIIPCVFGLFMSGLAAFAYAKLNFKGKEKLFMLEVTTMMIPTATMTIPSYVFYNAIGWGQGFLPLIIPGLFGGATTIFFLRSYMASIPTETIEAAKIDGLGPMGIYCKIMIPLCVPAYIAQFIFGFVGCYNNYTGPLLYLYSNPRWYTLQLALSNMQTMFGNPNQQCAAALIAILPLLIVYIVFQRFFIEGITVGGGKE